MVMLYIDYRVYNFTSIPRGNYLPISYNADRLYIMLIILYMQMVQTNLLMLLEEKNILSIYGKNPQIM